MDCSILGAFGPFAQECVLCRAGRHTAWRAAPLLACVLQVNYMYELDQVAENNRRYLVDGEVVAGPQVLRWLEEPGQAAGAGAAPE